MKKGAILLISMLCIGILGGCSKGEEINPLDESLKMMSETEDFSIETQMTLDATGSLDEYDNTNLLLEGTYTLNRKNYSKEQLIDSIITSELSGEGMEGSNGEITNTSYSYEDKGVLYRYINQVTNGSDSGWTFAKEDGEINLKTLETLSLIEPMKNQSLNVKETKTSYEVKGNLETANGEKFLDELISLGIGGNFIDKETLMKVEYLPVELTIDKETMLPSKLYINLKEVYSKIFESEEGKTDTYEITLLFNYDEIKDISVPNDVKVAASEENSNSSIEIKQDTGVSDEETETTSTEEE